MSEQKLFSEYQMGNTTLKNRVILAPMTRSRAANEGLVPAVSAPEYYAQRASGGLLITEASQISTQGVGYVNTPGIYSDEQVAAWKKVTDAVHAKGGLIYIQLWHVGRISHPDFHNGELPVGPSAINPGGQSYTYEGMKDTVTPRALELSEIKDIIEDYRQAAKNAKAAGFDGVEIHGANGYLPDQFLRDGSNTRTDEYGGSIENRSRFLVEVTQAAIDVLGKDSVGVRISPSGAFNGIIDSDWAATAEHVAKKLDELGVVYVHNFEQPNPNVDPIELSKIVRENYSGTYIVNGGYDKTRATEAIDNGRADLVAFGVPYLANPDLPERLKADAPLNEPDQSTFYTPGDKGYTDYPFLKEAAV